MSDERAAGFVAGARPTGIETSPKLIEPFQVVRIFTFKYRGTEPIRPSPQASFSIKCDA